MLRLQLAKYATGVPEHLLQSNLQLNLFSPKVDWFNTSDDIMIIAMHDATYACYLCCSV